MNKIILAKVDLGLFIMSSLLTILGGVSLAFKDKITICDMIPITVTIFIIAGLGMFACLILSIILLSDD